MARRKRGRPVNGWVILDKPEGMTSTQAVSKLRWLFQAQKAGHAGTLDPLATGLLAVALGEATKTINFIMEAQKIYHFTVRWGEARETCDREGEVTASSTLRPARGDIEALLKDYTGTIQQVPPAYSAIRVEGERAYDLARAGEQVALKARPVTIERIAIIDEPDRDHTAFEVVCGKGTYVRALARDFGEKLRCHGHVAALRRLATGPFDREHMISLEKLEELRHKGVGPQSLDDWLHPVETALDDIPALAIGSHEASRLKQGQTVLLKGRDAPIRKDPVLVTWRGVPIAIAAIEAGVLKARRVFNLLPERPEGRPDNF